MTLTDTLEKFAKKNLFEPIDKIAVRFRKQFDVPEAMVHYNPKTSGPPPCIEHFSKDGRTNFVLVERRGEENVVITVSMKPR